MTMHITMAPNGRMVLPSDIRKRLGLPHGGDLLVEETDDGVVLRTMEQSIRRAQAIFREYTADKPGFSVDDFLAQRKADSGE